MSLQGTLSDSAELVAGDARHCYDRDGLALNRGCSKCESSIKLDELIDDVQFTRNWVLSSKAATTT